MNGIYASGTGNISGYQEKGFSDTDMSSYQEGQQIQGIISKVSDQISINFSGREVTVPKSSISNAKEGEVRVFQITDLSKNGMVLKEVGSTENQGDTQNHAIIFTKWDTDSQAVLNKAESEDASAKETDNGEEISSRMTSKDYKQLACEGVSLESYELERLARALERIKLQREENTVSLEKQTEKLKSETKEFRDQAKRAIAQSGLQEHIINQLMSADLPVTTENIGRLERAVTMADEVAGISDSAKYFLIKNELSPTISNVYKASHVSGAMSGVTQDGFEEIEEAVDALTKDHPKQQIDNAKEQARWLFSNGLYVTKETIDYKMSLDTLKTEFNLNDVIKESVQQLRNGENAEDAFMTGGSVKKYESLMSALDKITLEQIAGAVKEANESGMDENDLSISSIRNAAPAVVSQSAAELTARRCLEEIRLKLTYDSMQTMEANGIAVDTEGLNKVVESLRAQELKVYEALAKEAGAVAPEAATILADTQSALNVLKESSAYPLSTTFLQRHEITLSELSDTANASDSAFKQAVDSYETLMTAPRKDMGDSIQKAFQNVDSMLKDLELETTNANQRAVRILGYNSIEITRENVESMKAYDALVNDTIQNLSPAVTATLVKEGINPLSIPMDELSTLADSVKESLGESKEKKFSEFLVELEDKKEITQEERESYVGIYRILHQVEASDGAVVGAIVKSGRDLTLNNLLTELRTQKGSHSEYQIDDSFGVDTSSAGYQNSILDQANTAFSETTGYQKHLLDSFRDHLAQGTLNDMTDKSEADLYDMSIEKLNESMDAAASEVQNTENPRFDSMIETLKTSADTARFLNEYGIADSVLNLNAMRSQEENPSFLYEMLQKSEKDKESGQRTDFMKVSTQLIDACTNKESMQSAQNEVLSEYETTLKEQIWNADTNAGIATDITQALQNISLLGQLSNKESYQIPVVSGNTVSNINLTVIHNASQKGVVKITYPTKSGETIYLELKTNESTVKGLITCENASITESLQNQKEEFSQMLSELSFDTVVLNFGSVAREQQQFIYANGTIYKQSQNSETSQSNQTSVSTDILYGIAKKFIEHLTTMEQ